jgi:uncharacterized protein (TIGR03086 family)
MDILTTLEKSANATATVARGVRHDQFDSPTPCTEWNVEELMNHLIGTLEYFKARGEGKASGPPESAPRTTYDQTVEHLQEAATATAETWQRPGALEQTVDTGRGKMPGSALSTLVASEMLTHAWDLAKSDRSAHAGRRRGGRRGARWHEKQSQAGIAQAGLWARGPAAARRTAD